MFDNGYFRDRLLSGELHTMVKKEYHPSPDKAFEPTCTRSQLLAYLDGNSQVVALVHQFKRMDGSIGASGKPDPKLIFVDGIYYYV